MRSICFQVILPKDKELMEGDPANQPGYRSLINIDRMPLLGFDWYIDNTMNNYAENPNLETNTNKTYNWFPNDISPYAAIGVAGKMLNTISNDNIAKNASSNAVLGNAVSGNTVYDLVNNDKLNKGLQNVRDNRIDYSNVKNNFNLYNTWSPNQFQDNIHYAQNGGHQYSYGDNMNHLGSMLGATATGAAIGSTILPGIGTVVGAGLGAGMSVINEIKNKRNAQILNDEIDRQNQLQLQNFYDTANLNNQRELRTNMYNIFQMGGYLPEDNGITQFNVGDTHQNNPYGGIQQGIASDNKPNLVEEGEIKYKDYIYSARNKVSKSLLKKYNLPEKYADKKFAEVAEQLQKESKDRPNDPVSKNTLDEMMGRLANAQEEYNYKREQRQLANIINKLSPEEKLDLAQMAMQQPIEEMPQEEFNPYMEQYASGGSIHIAPSKKGTFTAAATKHGKSVQEFARQVLANPDNYSEVMRKKAQFARNAAKWHEDGGNLFQEGGFTHPRKTNQSLGYNDTFEYFNNGKYDDDYLNWLNNIALQSEDDEAFKYLSDIYRQVYNKKLTLEKARALGQDKKFGDFHRRFGELYKQYLDSQNPQNVTPNITKRFWILDSNGNRIPINIDSTDANIEGYTYNPELDESEGVLDDGSGIYDYYFEPNNINSTVPKDIIKQDITEPIKDNLLRKMPVIGSGLSALGAFATPADFTYANELNRLASMYNPIAAPALGGHRRYNPYDVNLANNEGMAQLASMQRANRENTNRAAQTAANIATFNAYAKDNAARNLAWQQANEANRLSTDQYNLGIDQFNLNLAQAYDQLNQQINDKRINMLVNSAKAADDATTLASTNRSQALTNFLNNLGALGKENLQWALVNRTIDDNVLQGNAPKVNRWSLYNLLS